jgi:hypothetical protein
MEASMALKGRMSRTILNVSFLALDLSLFLYLSFPSNPGNIDARRPTRTNSSQSIQNVEASILRSVYVADSLVLPVVQQPSGKPNYVSTNNGEVTQFSSASEYGNIGLLAHNYLSGESFSHLAVGQEVRLVYDDGDTEYFVVSQILQYQALDPKSPFSSFQNLNNQNEILSAQQMFERVYEGDHHITFQTCIAKYGESSWGRLFVVAVPESRSLGFVH